MTKSARIPQPMQEKFDSICNQTDTFCDKYLDEEYKQHIRFVVAALCRKRPSPLLRGNVNTWAAGIIHALGMANFLFDKTQTPHCKAAEIFAHFGISPSTGQNKSKEIRDMLGMHQMSPEWSLPSRVDNNPLVWMLRVNGMVVDARHMPIEVQQIAFEKGLIPYIPGLKDT